MFSIANVLGEVKPVQRFYGDGSYDCPHCHYAVRADEGFGPCRNPWCVANPQMPVESARELVKKAMQIERDKADRERNHRLAMERIGRDNEAREQRYREAHAASIAEGFCYKCYCKSRFTKKTKHRGVCSAR